LFALLLVIIALAWSESFFKAVVEEMLVGLVAFEGCNITSCDDFGQRAQVAA